MDAANGGCSICQERESLVMYSCETARIIWGAGSRGAATKVGQVLVVPRRHVAEIKHLSKQELLGVVVTVNLAMRATYSAWFGASSWPTAGIGQQASANIGFNYGHDSDDTMGIHGSGHLHIFVIPRNPNDTNFMWWTTKASILHIRDDPVKQALQHILLKEQSTEADGNSHATVEGERAVPATLESAKPRDDIPVFSFDQPEEGSCPLCRETDALDRNESGQLLFSVKPYKYGHVMVIPRRHVATLALCTPKEVWELMQLVIKGAAVTCEATGTSSYSVGTNIGPHSGASIPSHLHIHVVPRYTEDSSVMYWTHVKENYGSVEKPSLVRRQFSEANAQVSTG